jgi:hypothetical protein
MQFRSYTEPGISWRVGVTGIVDSAALAKLGPIATAIVAKAVASGELDLSSLGCQSQIDPTLMLTRQAHAN